MNSEDILTELVQIRHCTEALLQRGESRFSFTPENSLPHVILSQSYSVEEVARIAASCAGETHQERIIEALGLLEAAERIANPDPWENQHLQRQEGYGQGDIPDFDAEQVIFVLEQMAPEIISQATNEEGQIARKELCKIACTKAGRLGKKKEPLSDDRTEALFLEGWLPYAAESRARWEVFRQIRSEQEPPCEAVILAMSNSRGSQERCDALARSWQGIREEKQAAFGIEASEAVIAEIEARILIAESKFRAARNEAWTADREVSLAWSNFYSDEVDRRRAALTEDQRKQEREAFRLSVEKGINTQPRIILDDKQARLILIGCDEFDGLLKFLMFPLPNESRPVTPPRPRGEFGQFMTQPKCHSGEFEKWGDDGSASAEYPIVGLPNEDSARTATNQWRKKK